MEPMEFAERLKRYRKQRDLTQQQLADALGASNKSVSRWESGGGLPDVGLLVPLARVLGVTVDDLLDEEKPVRALTRADWQGLLSFAFALGGGVLFYLLRLFSPLFVCYAGYLGCLAYGAWLQRYYARHSRWFWLGAAGMDLSVNLSVTLYLATSARILNAYYLLTGYDEKYFVELPLLGRLDWRLTLLPVGAAVAVTALTMLLVWKKTARPALRPASRPAPPPAEPAPPEP